MKILGKDKKDNDVEYNSNLNPDDFKETDKNNADKKDITKPGEKEENKNNKKLISYIEGQKY